MGWGFESPWAYSFSQVLMRSYFAAGTLDSTILLWFCAVLGFLRSLDGSLWTRCGSARTSTG